MADFVRAAALAKRLIESNGRPVTLYRQNRTADNSAQEWRGSSTAPASSKDGEGVTVTACFVPPSGSGLGKIVSVDELLEKRITQVALVASTSISGSFTVADIENADLLEDGDQIYRIETKSHLKPGSTSLLFALVLIG